MLAQNLLIIGALIFGVLGTVHLVYTFFTDNFSPRDPSVEAAMSGTSPILTGETTLWRAWVGFNASHSLGAIVFAIFYIMLASAHMPVIRQTPAFAWLALINALAWLALARKYWFRIPFFGIAVSCGCFFLACVLLAF
ncbi:MAG: hypothetical protein ABI411_00105 [Tahibacter sp.]